MKQTTLSFMKSGGPRMSVQAKKTTADTRTNKNPKKEELLTKEEDFLQTPSVGQNKGGPVGDTKGWI